jgi:hypothetical protein
MIGEAIILSFKFQDQPLRRRGKMFKRISSIISIPVICIFLTCAPVLAGERFTDNGDGTVTDHKLGLMWAKTDNQGNIDWKQAQLWVKYTFPDTLEKNYDNWRLPTLKELQSLVVKEKTYRGYETDCGQWVKIVPEIKLSCGWVWTSDEIVVSRDLKGNIVAPTVRIFNFDNVYHYSVRKVQNRAYRALPVREIE